MDPDPSRPGSPEAPAGKAVEPDMTGRRMAASRGRGCSRPGRAASLTWVRCPMFPPAWAPGVQCLDRLQQWPVRHNRRSVFLAGVRARALVPAYAGMPTAGAGSGWSRTRPIHPAPFRAPLILLVVIGMRSASASASPSRGPGNGILRAETGGRLQAQNAGERPEFGSQTATRLTNRPELRGFLSTRKPRRFARTGWWAIQGSNL